MEPDRPQPTGRKRPNPVVDSLPPAKRQAPEVEQPGHAPPAAQLPSTVSAVESEEISQPEAEDEDEVEEQLDKAELRDEATFLNSDLFGGIDDYFDEPGPGDLHYCAADDVMSPGFSDTENPVMGPEVIDVDQFSDSLQEAGDIPVPQSQKGFQHAKEKRFRKPFFNPRMWPQGAQRQVRTNEHRSMENDNGTITCAYTNYCVKPSDDSEAGDIWKEFRPHCRIAVSTPFLGLPREVESRDFLHAVARLGTMIHPRALSVLLGPHFRTPEYCQSVLSAFLSLINIRKVRKLLGHSPSDPSKDIIVFGDGSFLCEMDSEEEGEDSQPQQQPQTAVQSQTVSADPCLVVVPVTDSPHEDPLIDEVVPNVSKLTVEELRGQDDTSEPFYHHASYVLREYMRGVTGRTFYTVSEYQRYCAEAGLSMECFDSHFACDREISTLTTELVPSTIVRDGTASLWQNALKEYSNRDLSRCAILRPDILLRHVISKDLEEVDYETPADVWKKMMRPVVSIAPSALLYLAEAATNLALQILSVTIACTNSEIDANGVETMTLTSGAIVSAASLVLRKTMKSEMFLDTFSDYPYAWRAARLFPFTPSDCITLCKRYPAAQMKVPHNAVLERRESVYCFAVMYRSKGPRMMKKLGNAPLADEQIKVDDNAIRNQSTAGSATKSEAAIADVSNGSQEVATKNKTEGTGNGQKEDKSDGDMPEDIVDRLRSWTLRKHELFALVKELPKNQYQLCEDGMDGPSIQEYIKQQPNESKVNLYSCLCTRRLGWIAMHALGIVSDDALGVDPSQVIGYGSMVNYTNFGQLSVPNTRIIARAQSIIQLSWFVDSFIKHETAILMECAAHDNRRPWIDAADVALVKALRKDFSDNLRRDHEVERSRRKTSVRFSCGFGTQGGLPTLKTIQS